MRTTVFLIFLSFLVSAGCATDVVQAPGRSIEVKARFTQHFPDSLFKVTEKRLFSVEIVTNRTDLGIDRDAVGIIIHNERDEDVAGAAIQLVVRGHHDAGSPVITDKGNGLYVVRNFSLRGKGEWSLKVAVKKGPAEDSAVFSFSGLE